MKNPLLEPFDLAPFSKIRTEHFKPAFLEALQAARAEIEAIAQQTGQRGHPGLIVRLDTDDLHTEAPLGT